MRRWGRGERLHQPLGLAQHRLGGGQVGQEQVGQAQVRVDARHRPIVVADQGQGLLYPRQGQIVSLLGFGQSGLLQKHRGAQMLVAGSGEDGGGLFQHLLGLSQLQAAD